MTQRTPLSAVDPKVARAIAKHLDRRRIRRRLLGWLVLLGLIAAAATYLTCGHGFGLGGSGRGSGEGPGSVRALTATRCAVRIAAGGITVDGKPMLRDEAVAACKAAGGADVTVTGDAREGDWKDLQSALGTAGVTDVVVQQGPGHAAPPPGREPK